jgi:hypothetical protein
MLAWENGDVRRKTPIIGKGRMDQVSTQSYPVAAIAPCPDDVARSLVPEIHPRLMKVHVYAGRIVDIEINYQMFWYVCRSRYRIHVIS